MKLYGIYEQVVGVPALSLSQLRGPWPENVEDPCLRPILQMPSKSVVLTLSRCFIRNHGEYLLMNADDVAQVGLQCVA